MNCSSIFCLNESGKNRRYCNKCRSRKYRLKNATVSTYNILRTNAKRRGILFSLTLLEWQKFCECTNYLNLRGTRAEDMTVDRINDCSGYEYFNIRMITMSQNSKKANTRKAKIKAMLKTLKDNNAVIDGVEAPF